VPHQNIFKITSVLDAILSRISYHSTVTYFLYNEYHSLQRIVLSVLATVKYITLQIRSLISLGPQLLITTIFSSELIRCKNSLSSDIAYGKRQ